MKTTIASGIIQKRTDRITTYGAAFVTAGDVVHVVSGAVRPGTPLAPLGTHDRRNGQPYRPL